MFGLTESALAGFAVNALAAGLNMLEHYESQGVKIDNGHLIDLRAMAVRVVCAFNRFAAASGLEPHERQPISAAECTATAPIPKAAVAAAEPAQQQPAATEPAAPAAAAAEPKPAA
jgi:hypothetical protein